MLQLNQLCCGYPSLSKPVVDPVETELKAGEFVCVIGRNGVGKSTLMRTIAGLQPAISGSAHLMSNDLAQMTANERARHLAVVTTVKVNSPGLLVDDVLALGRLPFTNWRNQLTQKDFDIINNAIEMTNISAHLGQPLNSLSDGQRQRVMVARALAQTPKVMILDEITAFLDLPSRVEIMVMLRNHAKQNNGIVLLSSHDLDLSLELADKVWLMEGGQLHDGSPNHLIDNDLISDAFSSQDIGFSKSQKRFILAENESTPHH